MLHRRIFANKRSHYEMRILFVYSVFVIYTIMNNSIKFSLHKVILYYLLFVCQALFFIIYRVQWQVAQDYNIDRLLVLLYGEYVLTKFNHSWNLCSLFNYILRMVLSILSIAIHPFSMFSSIFSYIISFTYFHLYFFYIIQ